MNHPKITVAIPAYEMHGHAVEFLKRSLTVLRTQSFKDFEVVVSDNSHDYDLKYVCEDFHKMEIRYIRNPVRGMAQNTNEAIRQSHGELVKILYLDDFMAHDDSLKDIVDNFEESDDWLVTPCSHYNGFIYTHVHRPYYNEDIYTGKNTIGSPSVLTVRNRDPLMFDENMTWLLDCDYYKRLFTRYGPPKITSEVNVVIGVGKHQATHNLSSELKEEEYDYLIKKYE